MLQGGLVAAALARLAAQHLVWPSAAFIEYAAAVCAQLFFFSPMVQMWQLYRSGGKSLGSISPQTMVLMFLNIAVWLIFGIFAPVWPLVRSNVPAILATSFFLLFCWGYVIFGGISSARWGRAAAFGTCGALLLTAGVAAYAQGSPARAQHVGFLAMGINICLFASPLSQLKQVIKQKSSESLPPVQCCMQFLCSLLWFAVGLQQNALQVAIPNGLGIVLAAVQLLLIAMFPSDSTRKTLP